MEPWGVNRPVTKPSLDPLTTVDFILNLAALLLWLHWRSLRHDALHRAVPVTLIGTLKPATPSRWRGWQMPAGVALILLLRALVYWGIGGPVGWAARLDLGAVVLAFGADRLATVALFSVLSFLRLALLFYGWLIVLNLVNRPVVETDPIARSLRLQLGCVGRWPAWIQLLLPLALVVSGWIALHPLLAQAQVTTGAVSFGRLATQGLVIAAGLVISLKYLLPPFLLAHLVASYVYLGNNPLWDFVSATARNLLRPLQWVPLRVGKLDLGPLAGVILIFLLLHLLPAILIAEMQQRKLSLWPQ